MRTAETDSAILRFFRDDVGGIMITGENGEVLYADGKAGFVQREKTNWQAACPPARPDQ